MEVFKLSLGPSHLKQQYWLSGWTIGQDPSLAVVVKLGFSVAVALEERCGSEMLQEEQPPAVSV